MFIKISYFSQFSNKEHILEVAIDPSTLVEDIKQYTSESLHLPLPSFQLYSVLIDREVMLTDSWPISFFESESITVRVHNQSMIPGEKHYRILEEAIAHCQSQDEPGLETVFSGLSPEDCKMILNMQNDEGWPLLHSLCSCNMEGFLGSYIDYFEDFNTESTDGWTPLQLASFCGFENIVNILLEVPSIDLNKQTEARGTPLHIACEQSLRNIVRELLNRNADHMIKDSNGKVPIEYAQDDYILHMIPEIVRRNSLEVCNIPPDIFEGELYMKGFFFTSKKVYMRINSFQGILDIFSMNGKHIEKLGLSNIAKIAHYSKKNHYFEIKHLKKTKRFYTVSPTYRDDWTEHLEKSVEFSRKAYIESEGIDEEEDMNDLSPDNLEFQNIIEKNKYMTIYKALHIPSGKLYAIKSICKWYINKHKVTKYVSRECKLMRSIRHPFVMPAKHIYQDSQFVNIVMDYCPAGDLENLMRTTPLNEHITRFFLAEIILGIEYLHSKNIVHRDIKPGNILLDEHAHIKLCDFGLSKYQCTAEKNSALIGTPFYIPPEYVSRKVAGKSADIYALGVVMYEMLTGELPFGSVNMDSLFRSICNGKFTLENNVSVEAKSLIRRMMSKYPSKRPTIDGIKNDPFFASISWEKVQNKKYVSPLIDYIKKF